MLNVVTFEVEGAGDFPFDMLRYDACYPSNSFSAIVCVTYNKAENKKRCVTLEHRSDQSAKWLRENYPTDARWQTFGWRVVPGSKSITRN